MVYVHVHCDTRGLFSLRFDTVFILYALGSGEMRSYSFNGSKRKIRKNPSIECRIPSSPPTPLYWSPVTCARFCLTTLLANCGHITLHSAMYEYLLATHCSRACCFICSTYELQIPVAEQWQWRWLIQQLCLPRWKISRVETSLSLKDGSTKKEWGFLLRCGKRQAPRAIPSIHIYLYIILKRKQSGMPIRNQCKRMSDYGNLSR